ncbi:PTR2-domain-containing protein [Rhizopus microsporus var. microsporus]|uniref:Di/tri peptide transporter 2 n=2 Tax=Rhizopus microsporus TaxID=58291 RepID=A0A2G4SZQ9_RHIZD|nr:di/tri peptide transporter 2 [Rhizopus microsporus ATCC 52813]ORE12082.1 PTR2-domain-containing protein [Rhizopus microsporus var. microsporus]PHZ14227.1 di/tri peptide transporter 2 [Rhizopus microsporus ATCC 52813]
MSIKEKDFVKKDVFENAYENASEEHIEPTESDWKVLREVSDSIPKAAYLVIVVEFCERFTYYGLTGPFQNYIQNPDPGHYPAEYPGAMGRGQQTATALTTFFQFWCYITPVIGAIIADQYLGKYKTILIFAIIYFIGLILLTLTSIPSAIATGATFPGFIVSLIIIGLATGGIKSNVSPLVAEQYKNTKPYIKTIRKKVFSNHSVDEGDHAVNHQGDDEVRVIVSPQATYQKLFNMFYWGINLGSLASVTTVVLEKQVGFWAAYLLPTLVFIPGILIVFFGKKQYVLTPPRGSIFIETFKVIRYSWKYGFEGCKPSNLRQVNPELASKATWDDIFIDELRRTFRACVVFCWYPIYWLCYSQMTNNMVSMTATMQTGSVPNDIMQNINPLTLVIFIPIMDRIVYPGLRRMGLHLGPMIRITLGFFFAACAMGYAAGIQSYIYSKPPYYDHPTGNGKNDVSAGLIIPAYVLIGISEIFASITGLEYAYRKAPEKMKSLVMAIFLLTNCFGSILGFALVSVAEDPKLKWMYTGIAIAMGVCAPLFYFCHGSNDKTDMQEDAIQRSAEKEEVVVEYEVEAKPTV